LIDRNKKYIADAGIERPEGGGVPALLYDLTTGGSSLLSSIGIAALTRSPNAAAVYFGAMQKSAVYQEARAAGKTPDDAGDISTMAGLIEGGLEYVGLDHFMKALKGNTAIKRFVSGYLIEGTQEGSQALGEELVTQMSGVRKKSLAQSVQDVLYQAAIGGVIGGGANVGIGAFVQKKAEDEGIPPHIADIMRKYAEENIDSVKENLGEFIDKELSPIAKDDKTAREFGP